jgi:hypothetical protein
MSCEKRFGKAGEGLPDGDYSGCSYSLNVDGSVTKHER